MGVYALAAPARMIRVFGITLPVRESRSEVRAVYGGFGVAVAGALALAAFQASPVRTGIMITVGLALAGMALGRVVSAVVEGRTPFYPNWFYFLVEVRHCRRATAYGADLTGSRRRSPAFDDRTETTQQYVAAVPRGCVRRRVGVGLLGAGLITLADGGRHRRHPGIVGRGRFTHLHGPRMLCHESSFLAARSPAVARSHPVSGMSAGIASHP
ncbi:MAG: DUF4345 domain-containing protein [Mycobacteriaceae bacterium]|nr:DUF4345 domain-containing protein [Mycobacteriaceae bacterium]